MLREDSGSAFAFNINFSHSSTDWKGLEFWDRCFVLAEIIMEVQIRKGHRVSSPAPSSPGQRRDQRPGRPGLEGDTLLDMGSSISYQSFITVPCGDLFLTIESVYCKYIFFVDWNIITFLAPQSQNDFGYKIVELNDVKAGHFRTKTAFGLKKQFTLFFFSLKDATS